MVDDGEPHSPQFSGSSNVLYMSRRIDTIKYRVFGAFSRTCRRACHLERVNQTRLFGSHFVIASDNQHCHVHLPSCSLRTPGRWITTPDYRQVAELPSAEAR